MVLYFAAGALFVGFLWFATVAFRDIRRDQLEAQYGIRPDGPPGLFVRLIRGLSVGALAIFVGVKSLDELIGGMLDRSSERRVFAQLIATALLATSAFWIVSGMPAPGAIDRLLRHLETLDGAHRRFPVPSRSKGLVCLGAAVLIALLDGWISRIGGNDPGLAYLALLVAGGLTIWGLRLVLRP